MNIKLENNLTPAGVILLLVVFWIPAGVAAHYWNKAEVLQRENFGLVVDHANAIVENTKLATRNVELSEALVNSRNPANWPTTPGGRVLMDTLLRSQIMQGVMYGE